MKSRRRAREAALQALYQCDTIDDWSEASIDLFFSVFYCEDSGSTDPQVREHLLFARKLIVGTINQLLAVDAYISAASTRWSLARMARVDRNLLRLAVYELAFVDDVPANVTLNEAIEIAKRFGSDESPMFVNGVLDNVASILASGQEQLLSTKRTA